MLREGSSVSRRRSLAIWGLCCALAGGVFLAYAVASLGAGRGQPVLPLDDVYIHFQYARQIARGQLYVYNPGLLPSSGATSFLYPYLLAAGARLGFDGLNLALWAMGLGALALAGAALLVYRLGRVIAPPGPSLAMAALFPLAGPVAWHFMSGMETGLVVFSALLALCGVAARRRAALVVGGALLALLRPEGGLLALLAVGAEVVLAWRERGAAWRRGAAWLLVPVLAIGVQPLVNLALTGSAVASGNQAKSVFGMVPPYHDAIVAAVLGNAARMAVELITGWSAREGLYVSFLFALLALVGLIGAARARAHRVSVALIAAWLLAGIAAISTLETAFWHFKRYQMPLLALVFPLAAWGLAAWPPRARWLARALAGAGAAMTLLTAAPFWNHFALNVDYVYRQPLQMARWLASNASPGDVVAVHDTGMMRYMGGRTTVDMVGLTTPGAAAAWRNGPGAVAELLDKLRPDLIASYGRGHGFGLGYLADTSLYAEELARYDVPLDPDFNVALAADYQGIYRPDWGPFMRGEEGPSLALRAAYGAGIGALLDHVDVADLVSERAHHYAWRDAERLGGFPTDAYDMGYTGCAGDDCRVADGGRHVNGEEAFDVVAPDSLAGSDLLLVTRVHPVNAGTVDVYAGERLVATRWLPALPGGWLDLPTLIPAGAAGRVTRIRIVPHTPGGHYMPYQHWVYAYDARPQPEGELYATFQDGHVRLYEPRVTLRGRELALLLTWGTDGRARGDYTLFVHVLNAEGATVAQTDVRPGGGALPPGNWLPGAFDESVVVDLGDAPPGRYRVVLGLYDPVSQERLLPTGGDDAGRLSIGEVAIAADG